MQPYDTVWVRGPGPNSVYWQGPTPQIPSPVPVNTSHISTVTVPYRPFFSPTGLQARGMYSGYGACSCEGPDSSAKKLTGNQKILLYAGLLGVGYLLYKQLESSSDLGEAFVPRLDRRWISASEREARKRKKLKKNPKMKAGERLVRVAGGAGLTALGALGWFGPQAGEPFSTAIGLPISAGGIYLAISGLTSPEKAKSIRREVKG